MVWPASETVKERAPEQVQVQVSVRVLVRVLALVAVREPVQESVQVREQAPVPELGPAPVMVAKWSRPPRSLDSRCRRSP